MTKEELKNKCKERTKIFQQAMECCHSSSPIDCIEWFADRIADLEKENAELKTKVTALENANRAMVKELNDTTSGGLSVLENVVRSKEQLTKAKELLKQWMQTLKASSCDNINIVTDTEQFLKSN